MNILEQILNAADWIMFTIEEYEVYDNIVKVRSFKIVRDQIHRSDWLTKDVFSFSPFSLEIFTFGRPWRRSGSVITCIGLQQSFRFQSSQVTSGQLTFAPAWKNY